MTASAATLIESYSKSEPGKRAGWKKFKVQVTDRGVDDSETARVATGMPVRGDTWSATDTALVCTGVEVIQDGAAGLQFIGQADYSTLGIGPPTENEDPLAEPPEIAWNDDSTREQVDMDINGDPIVNSAKTLFDPPLEEDYPYPVVQIVRNVANFDIGFARSFYNRVNSDDFVVDGETVPAGQALMLHYTSRSAFKNGVDYDIETIQIAIREDGWDRQRLDEGRLEFFYVPGDGDTPQSICDENGVPLNDPVMLDGTGHRLAPGGIPVYLTFSTKPTTAFAPLALP